MKTLRLLVAVILASAATAFAQVFTSPTQTTAAYDLWVVPGGSDKASCIFPNMACKTIGGAINKLPDVINHKVTIHLLNTSYTESPTLADKELGAGGSVVFVGVGLPVISGTFSVVNVRGGAAGATLISLSGISTSVSTSGLQPTMDSTGALNYVSNSTTVSNAVLGTPLPNDAGTLLYYVDIGGSDNNACTQPYSVAGSKGPCATPQGALNKIPKLLRQGVLLSVDAGTYPGFIVSGFMEDNGQQQQTGSLLISGSMKNSSDLATGTATGTATSGSAGSGQTFGALVNSGATWTVNDLVGRFISTSTPTNALQVIASNTATTINIVGTWNSPTSSTTYTIQDPNVLINTAKQRPGNAVFAPSNNRAAIQFLGNQILYRASSMVVQQMRLAPPAGGGIDINDNSSIQFQLLQVRTAGIPIRTGLGQPNVDVINSDVFASGGTTGVSHGAGAMQLGQGAGAGVLIRGIAAGTPGVQIAPIVGPPPLLSGFFQAEVDGFTDGAWITSTTNIPGSFAQSRINCADSTGIGVRIGSTTSNIMGWSSTTQFITTNIATCGTGIQVVGPATADITSLTGSVATTGIAGYLGASVSYAKAGVSLTAGTNEINLDTADATGTFAGTAAGHCVVSSTSGNYSRVCAR